MIKDHYNVIGVMSGTSLDGVDLVYLNLSYNGNWNFSLNQSITIEYPEKWLTKLRRLTSFSLEELQLIDKEYSIYLSDIISEFIDNHNITELDFISSHGHTALHKPMEGITYQIGNLPLLAKKLNIEVICDFRTSDVELGGEGAPLVPIGDKLLFSDYEYCINLGGFANISTNRAGQRIAYDICPINVVLNYYVNQLGLTYDHEGKMASNGNLDQDLLDELNNLDYYSQKPPKSLGLEWVESNIFPLIDSFKLNTTDILRTFVEHCAIKISESFQTKKGKVLVTGGGAFNLYFIERLKSKTASQIIIPPKQIVEYKEAIIFALLGTLRKRNEINVLRSVTGASRDHCSGKIFSV